MKPRYKIELTKIGRKDLDKLLKSEYKGKGIFLLELISETPYQNPPAFEQLNRELNGYISRRISIHHRLVYKVYEGEKVVKIISAWTHYHK
jgi:Txe/YoeB family toxin of toxin-antitoxin system